MKKYNVVPSLLVIYLGVMAYLGWPHYVSGEYSALRYFGVIALSLAIIVTLRVMMKKRTAELNSKRTADDSTNENTSQTNHNE